MQEPRFRRRVEMESTVRTISKSYELIPTVSTSLLPNLILLLSFLPVSHTSSKLRICTADLCYNVRHFELHERDLEDPWSCRQSAIHQKYYFSAGCSNWIIVQPPKLFLSTLEGIESDKIVHPMGLHVLYIAAAMANWRSYLNYITEKLTQLVIEYSPTNLKSIKRTY